MRLATFNLENLDDRPGLEPPLADRLPILRPQLERLNADILCLQEVNAQRTGGKTPRRLLALERLLEGTRYETYETASTMGPTGDGPADIHNLVVLSRWPILEIEQVRHDLVPAPHYRTVTAEPPAGEAQAVTWDRAILRVAVTLPAGPLLQVINLHLRAPLAAAVAGGKSGPFRWNSVAAWAEGFFLAAVKRGGQALEARLLIDRLFDRDPEALIAVCGDFNAEENEIPLKTILGSPEDTGNGALAGRALVPIEHAVPESQRFSVLHHGRRLMLDHILVSRSLLGRCSGAKAHNEALGDELVAYANVSRSPESYHAPLVASFDWPG